MPGNTFGQVFRLTTWGESHGPAVGCVVDGCPAGLDISEDYIQHELNRRRVGQSRVTSARQESDQVQILSGVFEGRATGAPISMLVFNTDAKPGHYENIKDLYRPGHADYTWDVKYGFRDWRGGGRSSARETIGRVAGGAVAKRLLAQHGVSIIAWTAQLGDLKAEVIDESEIERNIMRCPDARVAALMVERVEQARRSLDSLGGIVEVRARGVPPGLGEPVFDKLQADIGKAMFSIPAIKGVEFGEGFGVAHMTGSVHNDPFERRADGTIGTSSNHHGGILGGISTGEEIVLRIAAKPPASIARLQRTVDREGNPTEIEIHGRHDPTVLPRLVPIAEAMLALVLADHLLRQRLARMER
ncbi:chorismate synthase [Roseiflexus castenholzii]|uniref:Chorismate synthase n=1 Tax=Roseiflexus castenholzii (strain DSM 13941 / HLO8) TaxID=383372 RepID=AROC_ROSCS|nr:chorismate synthase [Roseiflexus castenholzii]A7NQM2.1 RecName: Full=Chorismate synthase; Short=CS; AltName: Full=5-enolpyruvylshikimate-3-phosphate phospholyase [Roseiflexus castenholzii DSM 13941]ABU59868.1 Chorismate synthase [Roseiflexus castenholzii DSM 13941]